MALPTTLSASAEMLLRIDQSIELAANDETRDILNTGGIDEFVKASATSSEVLAEEAEVVPAKPWNAGISLDIEGIGALKALNTD